MIDNIKNQEFDRILITKGDSTFANVDLIGQYYDHVKDFKISMPQSNQEWVLKDWELRKNLFHKNDNQIQWSI
jgi:hypothetical protein